jgi:hypothetical protein
MKNSFAQAVQVQTTLTGVFTDEVEGGPDISLEAVYLEMVKLMRTIAQQKHDIKLCNIPQMDS